MASAELGRAGAEEGRGVDAPVEAGPALPICQLLLEPVEASELAAEVVDRMHQRGLPGRGDDRGAVLERAMVREDDVEDRLREIGVESVDPLDLAANPVVAARDLALEPAGTGQLDGERVVAVCLG